MAFFGSAARARLVPAIATVGAFALFLLAVKTDSVEIAKCNEFHGKLGSPVPPTLPVSPTSTRSPKS